MISAATNIALGIIVGAILVKESKKTDALYGRLRKHVAKWLADQGGAEEDGAAVPSS